MHYVKHFDIDGVATRQAACIELHGKPNAATEGYVGVLGIDMDSPLHDVYKCVAVNGSIYTWDLLSSGLSIMSATVSGGGAETARFEYAKLKKPSTYVIKIGDLILDGEGYLYQISGLNVNYCDATYCGTQVVAYGMSAYQLAVKNGFEGTEEEWLLTIKGDTGKTAYEYALDGGYTGTEAEFAKEMAVRTETWTFTAKGDLIVEKVVYTGGYPEQWTFTLEDGSTVTKGVWVV